jgi:hypothetical protein
MPRAAIGLPQYLTGWLAVSLIDILRNETESELIKK